MEVREGLFGGLLSILAGGSVKGVSEGGLKGDLKGGLLRGVRKDSIYIPRVLLKLLFLIEMYL